MKDFKNMYDWLEVDAFKHKNGKTHKVLQFLQDARRPVKPTEGLWNLWYDPVPNAPLARDIKEPNIARDPTKREESQEAEELQVQVNESQFKAKPIQRKLISSLDDLVEEDEKNKDVSESEIEKAYKRHEELRKQQQ